MCLTLFAKFFDVSVFLPSLGFKHMICLNLEGDIGRSCV